MAFERHRDMDGEISRRHGNTLIRTLRKTYGVDSPMAAPTHTDVFHELDEPSLSKLVRDREAGKLEQIGLVELQSIKNNASNPQGIVMPLIRSRCPDCGKEIETIPAQHASNHCDTYEPVLCPKCQQLHSVNRTTGEVLAENGLGDPW